MVPDRLLAERESFHDVGVPQALGEEGQHLALTPGQLPEDRVLPDGPPQPGELQGGAAEASPRRFGLQKDVVARVQLDELGPRGKALSPCAHLRSRRSADRLSSAK